MNIPKTTPKDFFLWLGAIIALYFSVGSLTSLLFALINELCAGAGISGYSAYTEGMTFSVATLIIIFPLYIVFTRIVNQMVRKEPELKEIWVRRWAVYLTIFLAGLGILIDLVTLVYTFLSGEELTAAFLLKVLAVLLVFGAVFFYYLRDIKGYWQQNEKCSKRFGVFMSLVVIASIVASFFVMGSPATQRKLRDDSTRINDLQSIQYAIADYYNSKEGLPDELSDLSDGFSGRYIDSDPRTGESYEYIPGEGTSFVICATFELASPVIDKGKVDLSEWRIREMVKEVKQWGHKAERTCFEREVDEDVYGIKPMRLIE